LPKLRFDPHSADRVRGCRPDDAGRRVAAFIQDDAFPAGAKKKKGEKGKRTTRAKLATQMHRSVRCGIKTDFLRN